MNVVENELSPTPALTYSSSYGKGGLRDRTTNHPVFQIPGPRSPLSFTGAVQEVRLIKSVLVCTTKCGDRDFVEVAGWCLIKYVI